MPTLGWRLEADEERFWEGRFGWPPTPELNSCPYCEKQFRSLVEVQNHIAVSHILDQPVLRMRGYDLSSETTIRTALRSTDVQLLNCTDCQVQVNGRIRALPVQALPAELAKVEFAIWDIRLANSRVAEGGRAERSYRIDFRIPKRFDLDSIDASFIKNLAVDLPGHPEIVRFNASVSDDMPAREYAAALVNYVLGVIIKEHQNDTVAPIAFEEYKHKYLEAMEIVREFYRPVAQAVALSIDFNLNGFKRLQGFYPLESLWAGHTFFRELTQGTTFHSDTTSTRNVHVARVCPIDTVTAKLLSICKVYLEGAKVGIDLALELEALIRDRPLSEYDISKIHAISALIYSKNGRPDLAEEHLRLIQYDTLFGSWSQAQLRGFQG